MIKTYYPSGEISELVHCFWTLSSLKDSHTELVYPSGSMQILFHHGNPFITITKNGIQNIQPQFSFCGQLTSHYHVRANQDCGMIGVVLNTFNVSRILNIPLCELTDQTLKLADVMTDWKIFSDRFLFCKNDASRISIIELFLVSCFRPRKTFKEYFIESCLKEIENNRGISLPEKSRSLYGISERSMQRIFKDVTGLSPKKYSDIVRFQNAIILLNQTENLTTAAHESGFYDQSHFIKVFKSFSGLLPSEFKSAI